MDVYPLFVGDAYQTQVWAAASIINALDRDTTTQTDFFLRKLETFATNGFEHFPASIRHTRDGVYAVQIRTSLFRIYGFFHGPHQRNFIAVASTTKHARKMNSRDLARLADAVRIRETGQWQRHFP
ncbi:MAG: hypothetical protein KDA21_12670 [Phycisphaerales bacterium]|nr:hypothetical protein [Phycisphaerales bacterium]